MTNRPKVRFEVLGKSWCKRRADLPTSTDWSEVTCNSCRNIAGFQQRHRTT
jgi:hypothetical protein